MYRSSELHKPEIAEDIWPSSKLLIYFFTQCRIVSVILFNIKTQDDIMQTCHPPVVYFPPSLTNLKGCDSETLVYVSTA